MAVSVISNHCSTEKSISTIPQDEIKFKCVNKQDVDAVKRLYESGVRGFSFQVFGDGPKMKEFQAHAEGMPIHFWGRLLYSDLIGYAKNGDIAVNPIVKGAAQSIINKHADYAAAGLPVVNTQECQEYRNLLESYGCGINCEVESSEQVAKAQSLIQKVFNGDILTDADVE